MKTELEFEPLTKALHDALSRRVIFDVLEKNATI
jgi:hypothetical protein